MEILIRKQLVTLERVIKKLVSIKVCKENVNEHKENTSKGDIRKIYHL